MTLGIGVGIGLCFGGIFNIPPAVTAASATKTNTTEITFTVNINPSSAYAGVEWGENPTYTWSVFDAASGSAHTLIIDATDGVASGVTYIWRPYATNDPLDAPASRVYGTGGTISMGGVAAPTLTGSPTLLASWDFDRSDLVTLSGSDIDQIAGADGTSYTLLTPGNMPSQEARGGKNTARFTSASSEYMQIASACGLVNATGCTDIIIFEPVATNATSVILDTADRTAAATTQRLNFGTRPNPDGFGTRRPAGVLVVQGGSSSYTAAIHLACVVYQGGSGRSTQYIDGEASGDQTTIADITSVPFSYTTLAAAAVSSAESLFFDGYVYRVIRYSGELNATQLEEVAAWATTNYGTTNAA